SAWRKTELISSWRHRGRARKRLIWARCRASQRTAPAARRQDILPARRRKETTMRITKSFAESFRPVFEIQLLRPGTESATMTTARLLPRLVRIQGSSRCEGSRPFLQEQLPANRAK